MPSRWVDRRRWTGHSLCSLRRRRTGTDRVTGRARAVKVHTMFFIGHTEVWVKIRTVQSAVRRHPLQVCALPAVHHRQQQPPDGRHHVSGLRSWTAVQQQQRRAGVQTGIGWWWCGGPQGWRNRGDRSPPRAGRMSIFLGDRGDSMH